MVLSKKKGERKSLLQQQTEYQPKDPGKMAQLQVSELDKFAKGLKAKRQNIGDSLVHDQHQLELIDSQIRMIKMSYDPLLERLDYRIKERDRVRKRLAEVLANEKGVTNYTKDTTKSLIKSESRLNKKFASMELAAVRGYSCARGTTFSVRQMKKNFGPIPPAG